MKTLYNIETGEAATFHSVDAKECLARGGWAESLDVATNPVAEIVPEDAPVLKSLDEMTVKELRAFAGEHGITLGAEATTKDAILAAIKAADWQLNSAEAKE